MANMGALFGGLMQGIGQGAMMGMQMRQRQELVALEKQKTNLAQLDALNKITDLPENLQGPMIDQWLKGTGVDPKDPESNGPMLKELFKSASADQKKQLAQVLTNLGLEGKFDVANLSKAQLTDILRLAPEMAKFQQNKKDSELVAKVLGDTGQPAPKGNNLREVDATPAGSATGEGDFTTAPNAPTMAQIMAPSQAPAPAQPQQRTIQGGPNGDQLGVNMPDIATRNVELYKRLQTAATLVTDKDRQRMLLDRADKLKDNAWQTLTPQQSQRMGFKAGAVVQYNLISNEGKVLQQGEDKWTDMTPDQRKALGLPEAGIAQVSSSGQKKYDKPPETFSMVPVDKRPPGLEDVPLKESNFGDIKPVVAPPSTLITGETSFSNKRGTQAAEFMNSLEQGRSVAASLRNAADASDQAVKGFATGAFSDQRLFLARLAELTGTQQLVAPLTKGDASSAEIMKKVGGEMTSRFVDIFKGNTNREELNILSNQFPNLATSVPGNKIIADLMRRNADISDGLAEIKDNHVDAKGNELDPRKKDANGKTLYQKVAEYQKENPLIDANMKKRIAGTVQWSSKYAGGMVPEPPKDYPDANFLGYDPVTGDPRFKTKDGRTFKVILGEDEK